MPIVQPWVSSALIFPKKPGMGIDSFTISTPPPPLRHGYLVSMRGARNWVPDLILAHLSCSCCCCCCLLFLLQPARTLAMLSIRHSVPRGKVQTFWKANPGKAHIYPGGRYTHLLRNHRKQMMGNITHTYTYTPHTQDPDPHACQLAVVSALGDSPSTDATVYVS